jgi:predicted DNA-binding transcriptional regulator AlpA
MAEILITGKEAEQRLKCSRQTLLRLRNSKQLPHVKIGGRVFYTDRIIEEFITDRIQRARERKRRPLAA